MTNSIDSNLSDALAFRPRLLAIAYRMLGSSADAEDTVQDAFLKYHQAHDVESPEGWLVRTTTRLCIDRLRLAKRREEYVGPWLPEPVHARWEGCVTGTAGQAEALSMAFMVLLEMLSPAERAAYLLREIFGYEFEEIATLLDRNAASVRQLVVRARQRLHEKRPRFEASVADADAIADQFVSVCRTGDLASIEAMLADDAVLVSDGGGKVSAAPRPIDGNARIAKLLSVVFRKLQAAGELVITTVNGQPGAVFMVGGKPTEIFTFDAVGGRICTIYAVLNPDKLSHWPSDADQRN